jgi:hypothetical protein
MNVKSKLGSNEPLKIKKPRYVPVQAGFCKRQNHKDRGAGGNQNDFSVSKDFFARFGHFLALRMGVLFLFLLN